MKLHGKRIDVAIETLVLPRRSGNLVFRAKAVTSYEAFEKLCPHPVPPMIQRKGQPAAQDPTDKEYLKKMEEYGTYRTNWMILESLKATEGLEWETVEENNPGTWGNYSKELEASGLGQVEIMKIINLCIDANGLNEKKIEAATQAFLASMAATPEQP